MNEENPTKILAAKEAGDYEYLRAAGRKGAEKTNALKKRERERFEIHELQQEIAKEEKLLEDLEQTMSANEHIISADGTDLDFIEE